ncbi:protein of unknown function [Acidithiobacillus ferrivorans]|uniref:Uncharacterized protein n=1 Tax=Acidithiobacillus ferrivorans TaxID=160808 RepID=A0ABY1MPX3_9PROT|nr:protein of unknown function [Acidithiobacillus ferrivorans]
MPIHKLNNSQRRIITSPKAVLNNTQISTWTRQIVRTEIIKQLDHSLAVTQARKR